MNEIQDNVLEKNGEAYTRNLVPGETVYGEETITVKDEEFRHWSPERSKLAAALKKGLEAFPLREGSKVLYLGAAQGTTPSHVSDIVGKSGVVYCVEFSERAMRDLLEVCGSRSNMVPILGDARKPDEYGWVEDVDVIYEDVAQPDQVDILKRNAEVFLKSPGHAMIAVKARAIDFAKDPKKIYEEIKPEVEKKFNIKELVELDPFEEDHCFIVASF
ncbi:MAG: fibrillarin-like rRNA/tRNA 2'-O-methyltransferase [Candidatus Aenigmatarchaeota archaeon]